MKKSIILIIVIVIVAAIVSGTTYILMKNNNNQNTSRDNIQNEEKKENTITKDMLVEYNLEDKMEKVFDKVDKASDGEKVIENELYTVNLGETPLNIKVEYIIDVNYDEDDENSLDCPDGDCMTINLTINDKKMSNNYYKKIKYFDNNYLMLFSGVSDESYPYHVEFVDKNLNIVHELDSWEDYKTLTVSRDEKNNPYELVYYTLPCDKENFIKNVLDYKGNTFGSVKTTNTNDPAAGTCK